jgi:hypothetical protein
MAAEKLERQLIRQIKDLFRRSPGDREGMVKVKLARMTAKAVQMAARTLLAVWSAEIVALSTCMVRACAVSEFPSNTVREECEAKQADLMRDIFNNPFRPMALDPALLTWRKGGLKAMAQSIYVGRRFEELPILADALEEAGCSDVAVLDHCRRGEHARGCWVLDKLLGKE